MELQENKLIYYEDNPNLDKKVVTTFDGKKEYRSNCKKLKGEYYVIGKTCFEIDGVAYRLNSGLIVFDEELKKYVRADIPELVKGVVKFDAGRPQFGFFTPNPYNNCLVGLAGGTYNCLNEDILLENGYGEDFSTGVWWNLKQATVKQLQTPRNELDHTGKGYNIEDNVDEFKYKTQLYNNYKPELTKDVRRYGKMLGDTTFGLEIECMKGFMPPHIQSRNGVIICRDGSLNDEQGKPGPEFVTIPLSGAKGLQTVSNIAKELSKRTTIGLKCSLHAHLGNFPTSRIFLVSLYRLACKIQNEVFQMFPFYKTNPEGVKQKNYNQKLPGLDMMIMPRGMDKEQFSEYIDNAYKVLFAWLSEGYQADSNCNRKQKQHPIAQKWNRHKRYYWINFMNAIFSPRNTIEFRLHTPTTNQQKIVNWLFICNAIARYANLHSRRILLSRAQITLDEVLGYYGEMFGQKGQFLTEYLRSYVRERKDAFIKDFMAEDHLSDWDIKEDKKYTFSYNGVTHLF